MALARLVVSIVWLSMYGYIVKHKALCSPCMLLDASGQNDIAAFLSECLPAAFVAYAVRSYAVHSGSASSEWANNSLLLRSHVLTRCTARGNGSIRVSDRSVHRRSQNSSKLASLPPDTFEAAVAKTVCRHAVKANDPLTGAELENLVEDLRRCAMPYTCPHGRPTLIEMNYRELEKKFGRTQ